MPVLAPPARARSPHPEPKTFRIKTFGCQMNVYDGERMHELLLAEGLTPADVHASADLVVLNTCHIREKAVEKLYSEIGRIVHGNADHGDTDEGHTGDGHIDNGAAQAAPRIPPMIAVAGCVAQAEGEAIMARAPHVRVVVGPQAYHRLPGLIARAAAGERVSDTDMPAASKFEDLPARGRVRPSAFLTVQEGCDKFCTYCVVPYTRGGEVSRPFAALVAEAQRLVAQGAREITLLGQNVNAWHGEDAKGRAIGLEGVIAALAMIPDLARIRYTTSHPGDMTEALIAAHGDQPKLMPFLHLPVQSGSDRILKAMNRRHRLEDYLRLIEKVRAARPDIALSGDFIVGFPGESEEDFAATLAAVEAVGYAQAFSFAYSPRPGTPAATIPGHVPRAVMEARLARLQAAINRDQLAFNQASLGRVCAVLVERPGKRPGQWLGKSPWLQSVHFAGDFAPGDLVTVALTEAGPHSLAGQVVARLPT